MERFTAFVAGLLFAAGVAVGGMTQPAKVVGFLDVAGSWDPSLAFVMLGAIGVHATALRWILARPRPLYAPRFVLPARTAVDVRLVAGAALFGAGWGLVGYCPGPALAAVGGGVPGALLFVPAMLSGMMLCRAWLAHDTVTRIPDACDSSSREHIHDLTEKTCRAKLD